MKFLDRCLNVEVKLYCFLLQTKYVIFGTFLNVRFTLLSYRYMKSIVLIRISDR